eukprot:196240_1
MSDNTLSNRTTLTPQQMQTVRHPPAHNHQFMSAYHAPLYHTVPNSPMSPITSAYHTPSYHAPSYHAAQSYQPSTNMYNGPVRTPFTYGAPLTANHFTYGARLPLPVPIMFPSNGQSPATNYVPLYNTNNNTNTLYPNRTPNHPNQNHTYCPPRNNSNGNNNCKNYGNNNGTNNGNNRNNTTVIGKKYDEHVVRFYSSNREQIHDILGDVSAMNALDILEITKSAIGWDGLRAQYKKQGQNQRGKVPYIDDEEGI